VVKVTPVEGYHASGHAAAAELAEFVWRVQPRRLIAIHTENAPAWRDLLHGASIDLVIPSYAEPIRL
jgi:mRNA degradation ribonuclease J1/J2